MNSKYLKYAIGEIILVVVGILIALSINNWNEKRQTRGREKELLLQFNAELQDTRNELKVDLKNQKLTFNLTDSIINYNDDKDLQPLLHYFMPVGNLRFYNNSKLFGSMSTYTTLKSTGLEIIENPVLRNMIADLYERRFERVTITEDIIFEYEDRIVKLMEENFQPYFFEPTGRRILIPHEDDQLVQTTAFRNILITLQDYRLVLLERYQAFDSIANVIQSKIRHETNIEN